MSTESRALIDALLMLFELLMAVFMEKHTAKSPATPACPPPQSPNDATARTRPGAKGKGPASNDVRCANTRTRERVRVLAVNACARCGEDLASTPPAPATSGAPSSTSCSRRSCVTPTPTSSIARAATPQTRACFPDDDARTTPVRPRRQGLRRAPARLRRCSRSSASPTRCTPSSASSCPKRRCSATSPQLHHALAQWEHHAIERLLAQLLRCTSTRPRCAWDRKESLDSRLLRRRH